MPSACRELILRVLSKLLQPIFRVITKEEDVYRLEDSLFPAVNQGITCGLSGGSLTGS